MIKRAFWLGVGVAIGVAVTRKAGAAARQATPAGIAGNLGDAIGELAGAIGTFGADVRAGMAERERELTETVERQTGVNPAPRHALRAAQDSLRAGTPRRGTGARARRADG